MRGKRGADSGQAHSPLQGAPGCSQGMNPLAHHPANRSAPMKYHLLVFGISTALFCLGGCEFGNLLPTDSVESKQEAREGLSNADAGLLEALARMAEAATRKPELPQRKSAPRGPIPPLPDVPEHFDTLAPITAKFVIRYSAGDTSREFTHVVARTPNRVYVAFEGQGQEWLFLRNPVDGRRVTGQLIDHHQKAVLEFHESDLANAHVVGGWADVMTLGISLGQLEKMHATGESQVHQGIAFERYVGKTADERTSQVEVWWSAEYALPWKIRRTMAQGEWVQELIALGRNVDQAFLKDPLKRFSEYATMDVVDWREESHGH